MGCASSSKACQQSEGLAIRQQEVSFTKYSSLSCSKWLSDSLLSSCSDISRLLLEVKTDAMVELLQAGHVGGVVLVVLSGQVECMSDCLNSVSEMVLSKGDVIAVGQPGEEALLAFFHTHSADVGNLRCLGGTHHQKILQTATGMHYLLLPIRDVVHSMLGAHLHSALSCANGLRALLLQFSNFSTEEVEQLCCRCKAATFSRGNVLFTQGDAVESAYLILSGKVRLTKDAGRQLVLSNAHAGDVLGETNSSLATAEVTSDALLVLMLPSVDSLVPSMRKRMIQHPHPYHLGACKYRLSEFTLQAFLGLGAFAQVALVRDRDGSEFALKRMDRAHLEQDEQRMTHAMSERLALSTLSHPFIVQLFATFRSRFSLFMLLEPCMGGELFALLQVKRTLDETATCFYSACVVSAFSYLHSRRFIYRDLKPENIMIHADGHIRLVDFGFAKRMCTPRTFTVCGTPEYIAPEMLMANGHHEGVDWWALGVLLYEMAVGITPFSFHPETKKPDRDLLPVDLYKNILNPKYELQLPSRLSLPLCELIERLLAFDPLTRLGCLSNGAKDVRSVAFYSSMHWHDLVERRLPAPCVEQQNAAKCNWRASAPPEWLSEPPLTTYDSWDADY